MAKQFFLVFGIPKSGTTFLQRMLDMHPQVSCPPEQSFEMLGEELTALLGNYERGLGAMHRRIGGHGGRAFDEDLRASALSALATSLALWYAGAKPICGLNENSLIYRLPAADQFLRRAKMIAIFRDPVDLAISAWRHNRRLAELEPDMADEHLGHLRTPEGTLESYVRSRAASYQRTARSYLAYAENRTNLVTTTYEALLGDKKNELRRLFRFLGADASAPTIKPIVEGSSREEMAKGATRPEFFGVGRSDTDDYAVSEALRQEIKGQLHAELKQLGYG